MPTVGIPRSEADRMRTLASYGILDTEPEREYDAITKLTSVVLDVPIALITFVDADRVWLKALHGADHVETADSPRNIAFDRYVIAHEKSIVITDATLDERVADNPYVVGDPNIRFYAGVPLFSHDGFVLGTLCAIDRVPRELTERQMHALELLAGQVVALLELRRVAVQLAAERARLVETERRLQTVFDGMSEGVVMQDRDGRILHHNKVTEDILKMTSAQLHGTGSLDPRWRAMTVDGAPMPGETHPAMVALRTGLPLTDVVMHIQCGDEQQRYISVNARPLIDIANAAPYGVITTFRDISEQRMVADRMARHQRLVTTGTLAAGVGHEINNPLTYMLANLALAVEELQSIGGGSPSKRVREIITLLDQSRDGGERVKRIVRGLKALARDDGEVGPTDVRGVVRTALSIASHELRTRAQVEVEIQTSDELAIVLADETRLTQVVVNLLVNAAQAFVTVDIQRNRIIVRVRGSEADHKVFIEVSDNGPGIPADQLPRIFDPFFSTKSPAEGTGLGLAISHGIIAALGGELSAKSTVGVGTTFSVWLSTLATAMPEAPPIAKRGRVLIVDDEPIILTTMRRMLQAEFEVVTLADPREAVAALERGERFDMMFSDISMSHLSGMELYRKVVALCPELAPHIVFVSGDLSRDDIREFIASIPNERVEKPFNVQELRALVRRVVAARYPCEQTSAAH